MHDVDDLRARIAATAGFIQLDPTVAGPHAVRALEPVGAGAILDACRAPRACAPVTRTRRSRAETADVPLLRDRFGHHRAFLAGQVDVWFHPGVSHAACDALADRLHASCELACDDFGFRRLRLDTDSGSASLERTLRLAAELSLRPEVRLAEPMELGIIALDPVEPASDFEDSDAHWHLDALGADAGLGDLNGAGVVVAVVDSGVALEHPDIAPALAPGWLALDLNFDGRVAAEERSPAADHLAHGTSVAGLAIGRGMASGGVRGVAPASMLLPLKIAGLSLESDYGHRALAIKAAVLELGTRGGIINLSWATGGEHLGVRNAIADATAAGHVVVCSAGNRPPGAPDLPDIPHFPSVYAGGIPDLGVEAITGVISVAATDRAGRRARYSYFGDRTVTLAAPGGDSASPLRLAATPEPYGSGYGTSFAAPLVAGAAALARCVLPAATPSEVVELLRASCREAAGVGAGVLDLRLLRARLGEPPWADGTTVHPVGTSTTATSAPTPAGLLTVNDATVDELVELPGVGRWSAERIVSRRLASGRFRSWGDVISSGALDAFAIEELAGLLVLG